MMIHKRVKRAMHTFDQDAKARLYYGGGGGGDHNLHQTIDGYESSSGSEHEALWSMAHGFFLQDDSSGSTSPAAQVAVSDDEIEKAECNSTEGDDHYVRAAEKIRQLLRSFSGKGNNNPFRRRLFSDVAQVTDELSALRSSPSEYRRAVMARLRERDYNAGICKVSWDNSSKLAAGSYEYVDVVVVAAAAGTIDKVHGERSRYIIDLAFAAQFVVARASAEYERVVAAALPGVMVAEPDQLRQVVRVAAKAARASLKSCGLHVPPWRKERYMMAKWFGPHRRKTSTAVAVTGTVCARSVAACRSIGFAAAKAAVAAGDVNTPAIFH